MLAALDTTLTPLFSFSMRAERTDRAIDITTRNPRQRFLGPDRGLNRRARDRRCKAKSTTTRPVCVRGGLFPRLHPRTVRQRRPVGGDHGKLFICGSVNPIACSDPAGLCTVSESWCHANDAQYDPVSERASVLEDDLSPCIAVDGACHVGRRAAWRRVRLHRVQRPGRACRWTATVRQRDTFSGWRRARLESWELSTGTGFVRP